MAGGPRGVLLVQLGTPGAPTARALRAYLRQFLGDPRVLEMPAAARWLLLRLVILPFRAPRSAALYRRVWTPEGSPLLAISRRQQERLAERLGEGYRVELGMRYGSPALDGALASLLERGCRRVLLVPLFPQYSAATTASVCDAAFAALSARRELPALRTLPPFPEDPGYIAALAGRVREALGERLGRVPLLISFHGIPARYAAAGDPYPEQCRATARALAAQLDLPGEHWLLSFQSRFGPARWLEPYTDQELLRLAAAGCREVAVVCPGFVADCLETIDEIGAVAAGRFRDSGGRELVRVPCLNDAPAWIAALAALVRRETAGWEGGAEQAAAAPGAERGAAARGPAR